MRRNYMYRPSEAETLIQWLTLVPITNATVLSVYLNYDYLNIIMTPPHQQHRTLFSTSFIYYFNALLILFIQQNSL